MKQYKPRKVHIVKNIKNKIKKNTLESDQGTVSVTIHLQLVINKC